MGSAYFFDVLSVLYVDIIEVYKKITPSVVARRYQASIKIVVNLFFCCKRI